LKKGQKKTKANSKAKKKLGGQKENTFWEKVNPILLQTSTKTDFMTMTFQMMEIISLIETHTWSEQNLKGLVS
jgi:hypothetical protein